MSYIKINDLSVVYGKNESKVNALNHINVNIEKGDFVAITGKSGCGKSTFLNVLGKITKPTSGNYYFNNNDITKLSASEAAKFRNENIGFVVQHFALINDITVFNNIALPMIYKKYTSKHIKERTEALLKLLEIEDKVDKYPHQLSGGQCQRVAIARALATDPKLILADEPTGALDETTGKSIMDILKNINKKGTTIILVTHDMEIAKFCNKQIHMKDGKIVIK